MADREKVIYDIERCICHVPDACKDCSKYGGDNAIRCMEELLADALSLLKAQEPITGETSDGYHTFNELYHHRAVLFSVIVANYPDRAWKSKKHYDGTMYEGMFIVGIETPDGQATYHYDIDPYWDMFKCRVLDNAPEWDGHTPAQAIERIGKLKAQEKEWIPFVKRPLTEEEQRNHPDWCFILDGKVPDDDQEILLYRPWRNKDGYIIEIDRYMDNGDTVYLEGAMDIENGMYWMPLPEPPKEE